MIKNFAKTLLITSFLSLASNASCLWNLDIGIEAYKRNDTKFAVEYLQSYTNNNPNDKDGFFWLLKKAYEVTAKEKNIEKISFDIDTSSNIEDYFDMAALYFEAGNLKEADYYADMMLKINPKSPSAYFIKAKMAYLQNDKQKALEYMNKAIVFNSEFLKTNLAQALNVSQIPEATKEMYNVFALEAYFLGDIDSSIKYLNKYLEQDNSNIDTLNFLCDLYIQKKEFINAQNILDEIFKINENDIQALLYQAKIYSFSDEEKYINTLKKAYSINPNNSKILLELGNYYLKKEDYRNSAKFFELLVNINDELYEGYFGYIYSLINLGKISEVPNLIRKAITINSDSSEINFLLAKYCLIQGDVQEAFGYIVEAIKKDDNSNYYLELAKINYHLSKYEQSLTNLKEIQNQNDIINKDELDEYYIKNYSKLDETLHLRNYLTAKTQLDKNRILYKYNLYNIYKKQGEDIKMLSDCANIKKIKPRTIADYLDLSEILYEQKGIESAVKLLDNGIKKFPDEYKLYLQKIKLFSLNQDKSEIQAILDIMQNQF